MTVMSGSQGGVLDFRTFNVSTLFNHNSTSVTEDGATYRINSSNSTQLFGVNLTFDSFDAPTAGLATDLLVVRNGVLSLSMTGIDASAATLFDLAEAGDTAGFLGLLLKGNDTVLGTTSKDVLWGLGGNDLLRGRGGTDTLDGGIGNDTLDGGSGGDRLIGGSGIDIASYRYSGEGLTVSLSSLSLRTGDAKNDSFSSIEGLSGGDHADTLIGNASGNVIDGGLGNDTISGLSGRDTLRGSYGADVLTGGAASDWLAGGAGADKFVFQKISDSAAATSLRDTIADFTAGLDHINLAAIDAISNVSGSSFSFIGTAEFTATGQLRAVQSGGDTLLQANTTGTSGASMTILLLGVTATDLTSGDFIL